MGGVNAAPALRPSAFETKWLSRPDNRAALADLPGLWDPQGLRPARLLTLPSAVHQLLQRDLEPLQLPGVYVRAGRI